jgi:hypothetical protein
MKPSQPLVVGSRYLLPQEVQIAAFRRHPVVVAMPVAMALAALAAAVTLNSVLALSSAQKLTTWVLTGFVIAQSVGSVMDWTAWYTVVTSERILVIKGFGRRTVRMFPLSQLTNITLKQSFYGQLLAYGTFVDESRRRRRIISRYVPYPEQIYPLLIGHLFPYKFDDELLSLPESLDEQEASQSTARAATPPLSDFDAADIPPAPGAASQPRLGPSGHQSDRGGERDTATEVPAQGAPFGKPTAEPPTSTGDNDRADVLARVIPSRWWFAAMLLGLAITLAISGTIISAARPLSFSAEIAIDGVSATATAIAGSVALLQYIATRKSSKRKNSARKSSGKVVDRAEHHQQSSSVNVARAVSGSRRSFRRRSLVSELTELADLTERGYLNRQEFEELKTQLFKEAAG